MARPLSVIAREIWADWESPHYAAVPYLEAMADLHDINDSYGYDSGRGIVSYFLANAGKWRGPKAKEIKAELNAMLKGKRGNLEPSAHHVATKFAVRTT